MSLLSKAKMTVASLMLGQSAQGLTFTAFAPGLAAMAKDFNARGHGVAVAQQSITIAAGGLIIGAFCSGKIIEILGGRRTMLVCLLVFGLFGGAGLVCQQAWTLLGSRVVVGFASACMVTACMTIISATYNGNARAKVIGASSAFGSILSVVGLLAGGALAEASSWRAAFIQFPIFGLFGLMLIFAGLRDAPPAAAVLETPAASETGTTLWPLYALGFVIMAVMFMGSAQFALLLPLEGVTSAGHISVIMCTTTVIAVFVSFAFGWLESRLGSRGVLVTGLAASALGLGLIGGIPTPLAAMTGAAFLGIYVGITVPYVFHGVSLKAAPRDRARAMGTLSAFTFAGALANPFICSPISDRCGLHGLFLIAGVFMAALASGTLFVKKNRVLAWM